MQDLFLSGGCDEAHGPTHHRCPPPSAPSAGGLCWLFPEARGFRKTYQDPPAQAKRKRPPQAAGPTAGTTQQRVSQASGERRLLDGTWVEEEYQHPARETSSSA